MITLFKYCIENCFSYLFSDLLGLDHKACQKINSLTVPCQENLTDIESVHSQKIVEILEISEKCLINGYMVSASKNALSAIVFNFFMQSKKL